MCLKIKFYRNTALPIRECIFYGCFGAPVGELGNCHRELYVPQSLKYLLSGPLEKGLLTSGLHHQTVYLLHDHRHHDGNKTLKDAVVFGRMKLSMNA